jgi:hypothetical protein
MNAFEAAEKNGRAGNLQSELEGLFNSQNKSTNNNTTSIPATFLRVTAFARLEEIFRRIVRSLAAAFGRLFFWRSCGKRQFSDLAGSYPATLRTHLNYRAASGRQSHYASSVGYRGCSDHFRPCRLSPQVKKDRRSYGAQEGRHGERI